MIYGNAIREILNKNEYQLMGYLIKKETGRNVSPEHCRIETTIRRIQNAEGLNDRGRKVHEKLLSKIKAHYFNEKS